MTGVSLSIGTPLSPWQAAQSSVFSSIDCAGAACGSDMSVAAASAPTAGFHVFMRMPGIISCHGKRRGRCRPRLRMFATERRPHSIQRERDDGVAALVVELHV